MKIIYKDPPLNILTNKPEIETVPGYDKNGNYTITLIIPDWKDKWKCNVNRYNRNNQKQAVTQYGDYQQAKGYRSFGAR